MKKVYLLLALLLVLVTLVGCADTEKPLVNPDYSTAPFFKNKYAEVSAADIWIKFGMSKIPHDQYETYPCTQNVPLSATLYKDGEIISIDPSDPRLIRMVNFFNNALYHEKCAYTQSYLPEDYLDEYCYGEEFRLELKYEPYGDVLPGPYVKGATQFDTLIVTNSQGFVLINHDQPVYMGKYPILAAGYSPFSWITPWLELFGF